MHGRAVAEFLIAAIDLAFLARCAAVSDWSWLRQAWVRIGLLWWGWLVLCSVPGIGIGGWLSLGHAVAVGRFLLLVAALQRWVLEPAAARRWLGRVMTACALYIGLSAWLQFATGRDLHGLPAQRRGRADRPVPPSPRRRAALDPAVSVLAAAAGAGCLACSPRCWPPCPSGRSC